MAILTELRDPRVENVTVTGVEVAPDMRTAKVMVSIMGDEGRQQLCLRGLSNSAGFLQSKVAKRIDTRYTPRLSFEIDTGVKKSLEVGRILQEIAAERKQREAELADGSEPEAESDLSPSNDADQQPENLTADDHEGEDQSDTEPRQ